MSPCPLPWLIEVIEPPYTQLIFEYDGFGQRIIKHLDDTNPQVTYHYYYNENWQLLTEVKDSDVEAIYHWHPFYIDALGVRMRSDDTHFFLQDANFNVTAAVDDSTNGVVERYSYTPYGQATFLDTDFSVKSPQTSGIDNELLYTGRRLDPETGLQYSRYRYYHAQMGRWLTRDPARPSDTSRIGNMSYLAQNVRFGGTHTERDVNSWSNYHAESLEEMMVSFATSSTSAKVAIEYPMARMAPYHDGMNLYQYVQSSPLIHTDPSGEWAFVIPLFMFGNGANNTILACQNLVNCRNCLKRAGDLRRRAQATLDPVAYRKWKAAAKPGEECIEICEAAGERGIKALVWFFGGVYAKGITPVK